MTPPLSSETCPAWAELAMLPRDDRTAALLPFLRQEAARVLRLSPARIEPRLPLAAYGLDSLGATELQTRLEAALEVSLPLVDLLEGVSLQQLADAVLARLADPGASAAGRGVSRIPRAVVSGRGGESRPSAGQRALWFLDRLAPESAAHHVVAALRIVSGLDAPALRRAFAGLVARHAALRTTFPEAAGEPVLRVHEQLDDELLEVDAGGWSAERLDASLAEAAYRPFDLAGGPLLRLVLFTPLPQGTRPEGEAVLLLAIHHIVADFSSLAVLARELGRLYAGERAGQPTVLAPLAVDFRDYVAWQEARLAGPEAHPLWVYWLERLAGELPQLDLPLDRPRPPLQTYRGGARAGRLDPGVAPALRRISRERGGTLNVTLLAAFQLLLHRYTGQPDLLVGSPTAGRTVAGLEEVVGYLVNPVALRADFSAVATFEDLLAQARSAVQGALAHADLPLALLAERLQPVRDPSRPVIFQVLFALQQARRPEEEPLVACALGAPREGGGPAMNLGGLVVEPWPFAPRRSQFDLTLVVGTMGEGLGASLQYNADLFDATTMERWLGHWVQLVAGLADDRAEQRWEIHGLPLLAPAEREQVLRQWNDTAAPVPRVACLHQLVAAQAERTPGATALVCGEVRLTYGALMDRSERLARHLVALGVGPEVRVGLCAERSPEMVAGLLGILAAGGVYVPIDPLYPPERVAFMLEDAQRDQATAVLLTEERLLARLPALPAPTRIVCLDRELPAPAGALAVLLPQPAAENLAYVMYTSGSTGRPKGVAIRHAGAVALVAWAHGVFARAELAGVLAATSLCFDLSVFELFVPLAKGGAVILAANALDLPHLPAHTEVTLVNTVPSAMAELVRLRAVPPGVRTVNLAGEPLPQGLVDQVHELGVERVFNLYGPSEDTTYSTSALVPRGAARPPAIGRPIAGTRAYVLGR
ncbi:MAG TPA: condensation domain-containing protein, partial [Thermoanaerobaculia bacterium]|nr:condensation domain-containing protein [Thermoanaerobaculia bacterium]